MRRFTDDPPAHQDPAAKEMAPVAKSQEELELTAAKMTTFRLALLVGCTITVAIIAIALVSLSGRGTSASAGAKVLLIIPSGLDPLTVPTVLGWNLMPNLQTLLSFSTSAATCVNATDARCCKTQNGPAADPSFTFQAAPGIASILTGVDAPAHRVNNNSIGAIMNFNSQYPTVMKLVTGGGKSVAIAGSSLLVTPPDCSARGIADVECSPTCVSSTAVSCNAVHRTYGATDDDVIRGALSAIGNGDELVVVQLSDLSTSSTRYGASPSSDGYVSSMFVTDARLGQLYQTIYARTTSRPENWLVITVASDGGAGSANPQLVPFIGHVQTRGSVPVLLPVKTPASVLDVVPTILYWLGLPIPQYLAGLGKVQFVCTNGAAKSLSCAGPTNSTS